MGAVRNIEFKTADAARVIRTARLMLRPMDLSDAARVALLVGDFAVSRMLAVVPHPYTVADAEGWIGRHAAWAETGDDFPFAIVAGEDGLVGCVGLARRAEETYELGYWLGVPYWGRGYASEAGRAALDWATEARGVTRFSSAHFVDNPASGRVLEKLGFAYTGVVEDHPCLARGHAMPSRIMRRHAAPPGGGEP